MLYFVWHLLVYYLNVSFSGFITFTWLGKRELLFLLSITRNYVVSIRKCVLFCLVLSVSCVMLLLHSLDFHIIIF